MPKKDKNSKKAGTGDAVRSAVERAFEGAAGTQKRTREVVDEVAHAAARVRAALEDLRLLEDVRGLRDEVDALARRVAALEGGEAKTTRRTTATSKASGSTASGRPAAAKTKSTASRAKPPSSGTKSARSTKSSGGTRSSGAKTTRSSAGTRSSGGAPRSSGGRS